MAKLCRFLGSWAESQAFFTVEGGVEATGGNLRVGPFNFATLLPVRAMLDLHRFQVGEPKEIGFDRNRESVDVEVFYLWSLSSSLYHQFSALLLAVSTQGER